MRDPNTTRRAARGAGRRRGFALVMMALLGLSSIGLAGTFVYNAGLLTPEKPREVAAPKVAVSKKAVKMMAPKVTGFDRKEQAYEINAKTARQDQNEPHVVHMELVVADLKLKKSNDVVRVTANTGIYDNQAETLKLEGDVMLTSSSGYTARLERADVWMKDGRIESDRPVTITAPAGAIAANGMEMWNDGDNIRFLNRARMLFKGDKKDQG